MSDEIAKLMVADQIFQLRRSGRSITEIAETLQMDDATVVEIYNAHRVRIATHRIDRDEAKELWAARYEHLISVWYDAAASQDEEATKIVMQLLREGAKVHQLDAVDPTDQQVTQNILIVGEDKASFIEALRAGRGQVAMDEKIVQEEVADE